ncbi:DEAD-box helicase Dbp80-like isoform X2 [Rhodnius prolixus]|uniref:DEAD-box helicase Dbp80-like isoform X2 n=1 Tax=Rhodnius prolixus TaxID=13249 RepID=UPI003D18A03E
MLSWDLKAAEQDVPRKLSSPLDRRRNSSSPNLPDDSWLMQKIANTLVITKTGEDIEKLRRNPFSPFHSIKSFEALNLKPQLLRGVYEMGFTVPSRIQETAIPILLQDPPQNMIAQSQSGTGKTAAFVLAMLSRVDSSRPYPQVVCLAPTYELAIQIGEVAAKIGQFCEGITFKFAVRGEYEPHKNKITEHVIIGTPDKVLDWANKILELKHIKVFVMDEADLVISARGHQEESFLIRRHLPPDCQIMFFSATFNEKIMSVATNLVPNASLIRIKREEEALDHIKQYYVLCEHKTAKYTAAICLYNALDTGRAIIFCQGRKTSNWLAKQMMEDGCSVFLLSGDFSVQHRLNVLDKFREGKGKMLITTSVLARGIDIEDVTIAVNFDLPLDARRKTDCQTYLHRIGRTGRFGNNGLAISFVSSQEANDNIPQIRDRFGSEIIAILSE